MSQYKSFLDRLHSAGYQVFTNWQQKLERGSVEHITVKGSKGIIMLIVQLYDGNSGYSLYFMSDTITIDKDMKEIKERIGDGIL